MQERRLLEQQALMPAQKSMRMSALIAAAVLNLHVASVFLGFSTPGWAAAGSVGTDLSFLSVLELYRTDVAQRRTTPPGVVEALD